MTKSRRASSLASTRAGTIIAALRPRHSTIKPVCSVTSLNARHEHRAVLAAPTSVTPSPSSLTRDSLNRSPFSSQWWPEVAARLRALGIEPELAKAGRNYENGNGKPVTPILVPDGWRHVPSADGVGVLAPTALFHPAPLPAVKRRPDLGAILDAASRQVADFFPATALWLLREGYFLSHGATELYPAMIDVYQALGRPSLAAVVNRRMGRHAR